MGWAMMAKGDRYKEPGALLDVWGRHRSRSHPDKSSRLHCPSAEAPITPSSGIIKFAKHEAD